MSMSKLSEDSAKALGDALNSSPVGKMFGMHKRPDPRPAWPLPGVRDPREYDDMDAKQLLTKLKERDEEIEGLNIELDEKDTALLLLGEKLDALRAAREEDEKDFEAIMAIHKKRVAANGAGPSA